MRRYLLALALVLLLAADLGWKAWSERPYIVTGYGSNIGDEPPSLVVRYRVPGGGTGEWRSWYVDNRNAAYQCWQIARIGRTIPDCMWSRNEIDKAPR